MWVFRPLARLEKCAYVASRRVSKSFTQHHIFFRKLLLHLRKKDVIDLDEFVKQLHLYMATFRKL